MARCLVLLAAVLVGFRGPSNLNFLTGRRVSVMVLLTFASTSVAPRLSCLELGWVVAAPVLLRVLSLGQDETGSLRLSSDGFRVFSNLIFLKGRIISVMVLLTPASASVAPRLSCLELGWVVAVLVLPWRSSLGQSETGLLCTLSEGRIAVVFDDMAEFLETGVAFRPIRVRSLSLRWRQRTQDRREVCEGRGREQERTPSLTIWRWRKREIGTVDQSRACPACPRSYQQAGLWRQSLPWRWYSVGA